MWELHWCHSQTCPFGHVSLSFDQAVISEESRISVFEIKLLLPLLKQSRPPCAATNRGCTKLQNNPGSWFSKWDKSTQESRGDICDGAEMYVGITDVLLYWLWCEWRVTGNRNISAQRKQLQIEHLTEKWVMVWLFSCSGQEASGLQLFVSCPLNNLVWPVLSVVLGTGWDAPTDAAAL